MSQPDTESSSITRRRSPRRVAGFVVLGLLLATAVAWRVHASVIERARTRLLLAPTATVVRDPALVRIALAEAKPLYARHCASCHGETMQGNPALASPNLVDGAWLYGRGGVFDIERTILYGIRAATPKTRHISDMPAFGVTGMLSGEEIREVVQYVLQLSGQRHDAQTARAGRELFLGRGNCFDCHGADGQGNPDYGAPDLTANKWNAGGDADSLYRTIYSGQQNVMPGWFGRLTLQQIRALAVYVHVRGQPENAGASSGGEAWSKP